LGTGAHFISAVSTHFDPARKIILDQKGCKIIGPTLNALENLWGVCNSIGLQQRISLVVFQPIPDIVLAEVQAIKIVVNNTVLVWNGRFWHFCNDIDKHLQIDCIRLDYVCYDTFANLLCITVFMAYLIIHLKVH
jgi:hypothetical protein